MNYGEWLQTCDFDLHALELNAVTRLLKWSTRLLSSNVDSLNRTTALVDNSHGARERASGGSGSQSLHLQPRLRRTHFPSHMLPQILIFSRSVVKVEATTAATSSVTMLLLFSKTSSVGSGIMTTRPTVLRSLDCWPRPTSSRVIC